MINSETKLELLEGTRECRLCKEVLPLSKFRKNNSYRRTECYSCEKNKKNIDRTCSKCKQFKKAEEFSRGKDYKCTSCLTIWRREKRLETKLKAIGYLGGACHDCKKEWPHQVYDFHHLDPSIKEKEIAVFLRYGWNRVKKELDKCVLLCANCHRTRHMIEFENKKEEF